MKTLISIRVVVAGVVGATLFSGCGKRQSTVPQPDTISHGTPENPSTAAATGAGSTSSAVSVDSAAEKQRQLLLTLTAALHRWLQGKPEIPKEIDLEMLVRDRYLKTIPPPPPGLHYTVNMTNLQVELVP
ncbi:MAG TPA: hypothetical protein VI454_18645 [Verrucomicrobiae bacterium]